MAINQGISENFSVSAKLIAGEEAECIADLMEECYPNLVVEDHQSYLSLTVDNEQLVFDMDDIAEEMGSPYSVTKFLAILASYKGDIDVGDNTVSIAVFAPTKS